jgi:hypothetical protein
MAEKYQPPRTNTVVTGPAASVPVEPHHTRAAIVNRASWGAVIAGALVALMVHFTLSLLGIAIGMTTLGPATEGAPLQEVGIGALIWWAVSMLLSLFAGGWVAGHLAGVPRGVDAALHGLLTWGLMTLLTFYLLTTAVGGLIGGAFNVISQGASLVAQGAAAVAPAASNAVQDAASGLNLNLQDIRAEAEDLRARVDDERLTGFFDNLFAGNEVTPEQRQAAVDALTQEANMDTEQAEQQVDEWVQRAEQAQQTAAQAGETLQQTAEDAAARIATAAFWAFVAAVLGAIVAAAGGRAGRPRDALVTGTTPY